MGQPNQRILDFMAAHKVDHDEVWEVRSGGSWAIKHSALERVAAQNNITFDLPQLAEKDSINKIVAMLVIAHRGDRTEWSFGEASPANNKNAYCYAMAEKRAKDRVVLKLLNIHGAGLLYSENEIDDAPKRKNPHVTEPTDLVPDFEHDEQGHPVDTVPLGHPDIIPMSKANSRVEYDALQKEMRSYTTEAKFRTWMDGAKDRVASLHTEWQAVFRGQCREHLDGIRQGKAA